MHCSVHYEYIHIALFNSMLSDACDLVMSCSRFTFCLDINLLVQDMFSDRFVVRSAGLLIFLYNWEVMWSEVWKCYVFIEFPLSRGMSLSVGNQASQFKPSWNYPEVSSARVISLRGSEGNWMLAVWKTQVK